MNRHDEIIAIVVLGFLAVVMAVGGVFAIRAWRDTQAWRAKQTLHRAAQSTPTAGGLMESPVGGLLSLLALLAVLAVVVTVLRILWKLFAWAWS